MIPGNDEYMRVLTSYSDRNGKVKMMCLGHVLLEEHTPHGLGNHAVIITEPNEELMMKVKNLLEDLHYVGFSNFDIKYDRRDGKYRFFEINTRQGRSNYYVTGSGFNVAKYVVEEYVYGKELPLELAKEEHLLNTGLTIFFSLRRRLIFSRFASSLIYLKATAFGTVIQRCSSFASFYYARVIARTKAESDQEHINMIILSHATMPDRTQAILTGNKLPFLKAITQDARDLEMLGVENIAIPCNTSHYFLEDIQKSTSVPIINMVEESVRYVVEAHPKVKKIGIMGTDGTMQAKT